FQGAYTGNAFADFLRGYPNSVLRSQSQDLYGLVGNFWSFFVQDNLRVTKDLTVNVGVRWELNPFFDGIRGQKTAFDLQTGKLVLPSNTAPAAQRAGVQQLAALRDRVVFTSDIGRPNSIQERANRDIAPRLGIAWRPFGSTNWVLRAAYGIFYETP